MYSRKSNCGTSHPSSAFICQARRYIINERSYENIFLYNLLLSHLSLSPPPTAPVGSNFLQPWGRNRPSCFWGEGGDTCSENWEWGCANWFVGILSCKMFITVWTGRILDIYISNYEKSNHPLETGNPFKDFFFSVSINDILIKDICIWYLSDLYSRKTGCACTSFF